jgi:hypothetical protein
MPRCDASARTRSRNPSALTSAIDSISISAIRVM